MSWALPRVQVSSNGRFLVTAGDTPFFWLGDTAWELFHRLSRQEAEHYLENRRRNGFNVVQIVALAEFDGLHTPNAYGETPLIDDDPTRPNESYWRFVDEVVDLAAGKGIYVGLLPTWADKVAHMWGVGPVIFNADNARVYARWLGERYRGRTNILWILGGDRPASTEQEDYRPIWRAMAAGIDEATSGRAFMTYHPSGRQSSSAWVHDEPWLDMNMMQSGHGTGHDTSVWQMIEHDYNLVPNKPVLDGEPNYEDHPVNPWPVWDPATGYYRDHDVRKQTYRSVFAGGCGVTYGHHAVWQFASEQRPMINHADRTWLEALDQPAATQMVHLRRLMESRPYLTRIPDQGMLTTGEGEGAEHIQVTRDAQGSYALVYVPTSEPAAVEMGRLSCEQVRAWWYDPRNGGATVVGEYPAHGTRTFTPPAEGPDWVLVLDDAARDLGTPGQPR